MNGELRRVVAIGVSAGGFDALKLLLPFLPADFPHPIVVVQHVPSDGSNAMVRIFRDLCRLHVKEAEDKEPIRPGVVYFAPPDYHLLLEPDEGFSLSSDEAENFSRPSIDVFFESVAFSLHERTVGIVLTGANHDGARGLKRIRDMGGRAVVQDPKDAVSATMPSAALMLVEDAEVMTLEEIRGLLFAMSRNEGRFAS